MLYYPNYKVKVLLLISLIGLLFFSCTKTDTGIVLQGISFKDSAIVISAGTTKRLIPVFKPAVFEGIPVVWSSSDPDMATVTPDGLLYAINRGTVWITIQDKNSATSGKCFVTIQ